MTVCSGRRSDQDCVRISRVLSSRIRKRGGDSFQDGAFGGADQAGRAFTVIVRTPESSARSKPRRVFPATVRST